MKLHWANADQYYIKTSEYFRKYQFKTKGNEPKTIIFELSEAETEQNNNKTAADKVRRFAIADDMPLTTEGDTLRIAFRYEPMDKKTTQNDLNTAAFEYIKANLPTTFVTEALTKAPTEKQKDRTLLEKHLTDYTARNSFDYFIHKDLGKFLSQELDFFIKNEVLLLDDIATNDEKTFIRQLAKVRAIKSIATKIITFLAQLENFQRRLWLKKKFVTDTQYCITLDRVPQDFYPEIAKNQAQIKAWCELYSINDITAQTASDLLSVDIVGFADAFPDWNNETQSFVSAASAPSPLGKVGLGNFLSQNQFLVLDTAFFDHDFKNRLIATIENLDDTLDGLLLHSENFQALNLLQNRYKEKVDFNFIDPPYNTGGDGFTYKDNFQHSSWLSFMQNRIEYGKNLLTNKALFCTSLDDVEIGKANILWEEIFGIENFLANLVWWRRHGRNNNAKIFTDVKDFIIMYKKSNQITSLREQKDGNKVSGYSNPDNDERGIWTSISYGNI